MSNISKRRREGTRSKIKSMGDHREFLKRITKTLYYGQLPSLACLSLPVTEISSELWSVSQRGRSLRRLHTDEAASISRSACVSPCALVLAILYLERLKTCNPEYLAATSPSDLFLVSLMVGNKFLQDDGEDDEVICSEWAASGGIEINQLKKLEFSFLNAIDWKVFVSEEAFESGLSWLERQVALKQAQIRGFFTYTDLVASYDNALLSDVMRAVTSSCLALTLGYVSSLITFVTSTLVISQAWLPTLQYVAATRSAELSPTQTNIITTNTNIELPQFNNVTVDLSQFSVEEATLSTRNFKCCTKWLQYQETITHKWNWYDTIIINDWNYQSWWSKTSVLNWLYQSSLINPMQRWLEKVSELGDFFKKEFIGIPVESSQHIQQCHGVLKGGQQKHCVKQWLNLSKLSALMASVSDR